MTSFHSGLPLSLSGAMRGFIHQGTDLKSLDLLMSKESITAYLGFDPTASSLHVGGSCGDYVVKVIAKRVKTYGFIGDFN